MTLKEKNRQMYQPAHHRKELVGPKIDGSDSMFAGVETVRVYIESKDFTVIRPVKELKDYKQVELKPNEKKRLASLLIMINYLITTSAW